MVTPTDRAGTTTTELAGLSALSVRPSQCPSDGGGANRPWRRNCNTCRMVAALQLIEKHKNMPHDGEHGSEHAGSGELGEGEQK